MWPVWPCGHLNCDPLSCPFLSYSYSPHPTVLWSGILHFSESLRPLWAVVKWPPGRRRVGSRESTAAPSPTQAFRGQELKPGWMWCAAFAELASLHLFIQPESHNQGFLIPRVGHFSKYERKEPVTAPVHLQAYKDQPLPQRISFLFTSWPETKWLCFLATRGLAHSLGSVCQGGGLNACSVLGRLGAAGPPQHGSWTWATLERAPSEGHSVWLQNQPWHLERKQMREGGLASLLTSLMLLSLRGPHQANPLGTKQGILQ